MAEVMNPKTPENPRGGDQHVAVATEPKRANAQQAGHRWWKWLLVVGIVAVAAWALYPRVIQGQAHPATAQHGMRSGAGVLPVVAALAATADVPVYLNGLGTVTSLNTVTVRSRVDGQLVAVMFKEGQLVRKGELLAQIDPRPFEVQLMEAQGQLAKDQAALKNAQTDLQRYQALFAQDAVPKQQLDTQAATVTQVEGGIKSDEGVVANAQLNLTYSRITSPVTGRVGLRLVDPGNIVHASDPNGLIVITERQPIGVLFTIAEDSLPPVLKQLHEGRTLAVEAWDRDLTTRLATGKLLTVDNAIDPSTGTVRLKAEFPNEDETLFPNQFVNARLLVDTLHDIVTVPSAAIQRNQQSTFVFVVKPDSTVEMRNVEAQLTEGNTTAIGSGLAPGEAVVIEGVDKLQPGMKVVARNLANGNGPAGMRGRGGHASGEPAEGAAPRPAPAQNGASPSTPNAAGHTTPRQRGRNQ